MPWDKDSVCESAPGSSPQLFPSHSCGQLDADASLYRFPEVHRDTLGRAVAQVVALVEQFMFIFNS